MKILFERPYEPVGCQACQAHNCGSPRINIPGAQEPCPLRCGGRTFTVLTGTPEMAAVIHLAIFLQQATGVFPYERVTNDRR